MLHDGSDILVDHGLAAQHLHDDVALGKRNVLDFVDAQRVECLKINLRVGVNGLRILIHSRGEPLLCASLAVFLGNRVEGRSGLQGSIHAVGGLASGLYCSAHYLYLSILHRVGELCLGYEFHHIEGVVGSGLKRSGGLPNGHRVNLGCYVARECLAGNGQANVSILRLCLAHHLGGLVAGLQFLLCLGHGGHHGLPVGSRGQHLELNILDVAALNILLVHLLLLVILGLEVGVANLHVVVVDG